MSSTGFLITTGGQAAATVANPGGPYIRITEWRAGSGVNYIPVGYVPGVSATTQSAMVGSTLYTSAPAAYTIVPPADPGDDPDTIELLLLIPPTVPSFFFGEISIWLEDGTMFAICVFSSLQEHVHAAGNQAGTVWRIRSRLKLQQLPAICSVELLVGQQILEVPSWQSLLSPGFQPSNANAAIVHDNNAFDEPVFVVRDNDNEWGLINYRLKFSGSVSDSGASATTTNLTHPGLSVLLLEMPNTTSKYLVKFADGTIRKITGNSTTTSIQWTPALGLAPTGAVSVWVDSVSDNRVSWADTLEYNAFAADFNPYWITPTGTFSASNKGLNQTAIPTLNRRTVTSDWTTLLNAVKAVAHVHGVSITGIQDAVDFIYNPTGPIPYGLETLRLQWQALKNMIPTIEASRLAFDLAYQEFLLLFTHSDSTYFSARNYDFTFDTSSVDHRNALLNGGMRLSLSMDVVSPTDSSWVALDALLAQMGTLTIFDGSVSRTGPGGGGEVFFPSICGLHRLDDAPDFINQYQNTHTFLGPDSGWRILVMGQYTATNDILIRVRLEDTVSPYIYGGSPGTITFNWVGSRPLATEVLTPVLAFPTVSVSQS
jgi:hypothetical protein